MALDAATIQRSLSPDSSGRASPVPRALPRREDGPKHDKNFRKYASNVERALALFEPAQQEWADYISFLGRLLKTLQSHPPETNVIPHSARLATRLAQCLNPTLPSGVHQKAIEVYAYIFATLGRDGLAADLQVYFAGLSSVLSFASLSVRPGFSSLIEAYILPLDATALRPALKAIILTLLPGLEDETSEDFDRLLALLDGFRKPILESYFWQCFFLATITNASRRQGALVYLTRKLPKISGSAGQGRMDRRTSVSDLPPEAQALITPEPGLLVRCFAAGLSDPQLLIQRGFLDLLVSHLPLSSPVLQSAVRSDDLQKLAMAAASVVNRRDMSLNRRLWSWFLGPEPKLGPGDTLAEDMKSTNVDVSSHHAAYFSRYGAGPLTAGIRELIKSPGHTSTDYARPFRICLSLMDRWEVGGLIVPEIFLPALESVYSYSLQASKEQLDEVVRSASLFFDGVESGLIWTKLFELSRSAFTDADCPVADRNHKLELFYFIITRFNIREEEMLLFHIPLSLLALLSMSWKFRQSTALRAVHGALASQAGKICDALIHIVPNRAFGDAVQPSGAVNESPQRAATQRSQPDILGATQEFYSRSDGTNISEFPFSVPDLGLEILRLGALHFDLALKELCDIELYTRLLNDLLHVAARPGLTLETIHIAHVSHTALQSMATNGQTSFAAVSAVTTVTAALQTSGIYHESPTVALEQMITSLVPLIWAHLSPNHPKHHVEAVRCLWTLQAISSPGRAVEGALTTLLQETRSVEYARRFVVAWNHTVQERGAAGSRGRGSVVRRVSGMPGLPSGKTTTLDYEVILTRPLFAILDSLARDENDTAAFVSSWLRELPTLHNVFAILINNLARLRCLRWKDESAEKPLGHNKGRADRLPDVQECVYFLAHAQHILELGSDHIWMTLAGESVPAMELDADGKPYQAVLQNVLVDICMRALNLSQGPATDALQRTALAIAQMLLRSPFAAPLKERELEVTLLKKLLQSLDDMQPLLQGTMLQTILAALQLQASTAAPPPLTSPLHLQRTSKDIQAVGRRGSLASAKEVHTIASSLRPLLIEVLKVGFSAQSGRLALDSWVDFFGQVLPLFTDSIFQTMIPFVEIFCAQVRSIFHRLHQTFGGSAQEDPVSEASLMSLLNGLEQLLDQAHQHLIESEVVATRPKSPEAPQGFFANMVPGVFSSDVQQVSRSATANNRLTVLLCFQDTVRMCFSLWTWGSKVTGREQDATSAASFSYTSLRVRNRSRRLLEHLFAAEALECLETVGVMWCHPPDTSFDRKAVLNLLNVLNGSKPKKTIPAMFNALYSRTHPSALEPKSLSTLTSDFAETEIAWFLLEYTRSLEDDTMDEIWTDCMTFLKDVLTNPLPHRQALPALLEFTVVLAEKIENTNFGEEKKMRRELSDLFLRLLAANFATRSTAHVQDSVVRNAKVSGEQSNSQPSRLTDIVAMLSTVAPKFQVVIGDSDRLWTAAGTISTNVIAPALHSKHFPENISADMSLLIQQLSILPQASKSWRKDVSDAFNDNRFFSLPRELVDDYWLSIIFQLNVVDKEKMSELLSRLAAPATAGIMFGVGATSARVAADKAAQLNLCRVATLVLACPDDTFASSVAVIAEKLSQLLIATPLTSPSSATRAELYLVMRALILKVSAIHLAPLWPIINAELISALASTLPSADDIERYDGASILQACKLLDVLVAISPDDFQLYEWLFVTDTVDAVYRPQTWTSAALVDEIAEGLGNVGDDEPLTAATTTGVNAEGLRTSFLEPILSAARMDLQTAAREDIIRKIVKPFFGQLSIWTFEATYGMQTADVEACKRAMVDDLFSERAIS